MTGQRSIRTRMLSLPVRRPLSIVLMFALLLIGGVLALAPAWGREWLGKDLAQLTLPLTGVAIAVPAFVALCVFARCENCGYKLFWHAVSKRPHTDSTGWFFAARECPVCGHSRAR